jgi:hypothetical protein
MTATGSIRWVVEWCKSCPVENGDADLDNAEYVREPFKYKEKAIARLREVERQKLDFFGQPRLEECHFEEDFQDDETGRWFYHWETVNIWYIDNGELFD